MKSFSLCLLACYLVCSIGCNPSAQQNVAREVAPNKIEQNRPDLERSHTTRLGTTFLPFESERAHSLSIRRIDIPDFPGTFAIWGGSGRDDSGQIFLGVSTVWTPTATQPSARAYGFDPVKHELKLIGDVIGVLKKQGKVRESDLHLSNGKIVTAGGKLTTCPEAQMKIHSKFVSMDDGWTYFASMDEWNENENGSQLPYWGSHLWRYRSLDNRWEELATVPEGLIAISGVGRYVFALGYFGHVVYRYDTQTGDLIHGKIGSHGGHISRNLLSNVNGHVFVPRVSQSLTEEGADSARPDFDVKLVELDCNLEEIGATKLNHYSVTADSSSHGITGFANLADGTMAFTTADGFLYQVFPQENAEAEVREIGWFHPSGKAYCPSLFSMDGKRFLCGVTKSETNPDAGYEWVVYDLVNNHAVVTPFVIPDIPEHGMKNVLLYGSNTRDPMGDYYLVGCYQTSDGNRQFPLCLQVSYSPTD